MRAAGGVEALLGVCIGIAWSAGVSANGRTGVQLMVVWQALMAQRAKMRALAARLETQVRHMPIVMSLDAGRMLAKHTAHPAYMMPRCSCEAQCPAPGTRANLAQVMSFGLGSCPIQALAGDGNPISMNTMLEIEAEVALSCMPLSLACLAC